MKEKDAINKGNIIIDAMAKGYGEKFPGITRLFGMMPTEEFLEGINEPIPALGRYQKSVKFLRNITSGRALGEKRFFVIIQYFLALNKLLSEYEGNYKDQKIVGKLDNEHIQKIKNIGIRLEDIFQAEKLEEFTEHDTAAAVDYIKLKIASQISHLENEIEGVHFACTSEDVMGNVFGLIGNELVYENFLPTLIVFCESVINYVKEIEKDRPLVLPALTHEQAAEPTTFGIKITTRLMAINYLIRRLYLEKEERFMPFSGKMGGAIGNLTCHFAAYSDINWWKFSKDFVENLGLYYEEMPDQCVSYTNEAHIFSVIANILTQLIKITSDFINLASCPSQFFVKKKKAGVKGSSIMPNKSNAWGMEGAIAMFLEARDRLIFLAKELPLYPHEGNMKRSYLMRNLGDAFMPIFIGISRAQKEMKSYQPNMKKIMAFFYEYPGMAGSSLQTVLKRRGITGDAYRIIQSIAINSDGSYANMDEFTKGLEEKIEKFKWSDDLKWELLNLFQWTYLVKPAQERAEINIKKMEKDFIIYRSAIGKTFYKLLTLQGKE